VSGADDEPRAAATAATAATTPEPERSTIDPTTRRGRRELLRRLFTVLLFGWLAGLWLHQVLDGPGDPVEVGAVGAPRTHAELGLPDPTERTGRVRGVVTTIDGRGAADVLVTLVVADELFWTHSDALGTYELRGLPNAGRATLTAVPLAAPGVDLMVDLPMSGPLRLELPPRFEPFPTLPDVRRQSLVGAVRPNDERAVEGYEVWLVPLEQTASGLRESAAPGLDGRVERRVAVERDGRFRVADLALGDYQVRVLPPWARGGDWPVIGTTSLVHTRRGAAPVIDLSAGAIDGVVLDEDGEPIAGALVRCSDASDPARLVPAVRTDEAGRFAIEDAPEGSLRLRVNAAERATERTVRVAPLRREQVELRLLPSR